MRYDDTLETVLAADVSTSFGKASAWRQLVDLIGRRRVAADVRAFNLLRRIRDDVPLSVRAACARGLEHVNPPAPLVALCAIDEISVAAPVLRTARLTSGEWVELLPRLSAAGRSVLRGRRDLPPGIERALESFGPADFVVTDAAAAARAADVAPDSVAAPEIEPEVAADAAMEAMPELQPEPAAAADLEPEIPVEPEPELAEQTVAAADAAHVHRDEPDPVDPAPGDAADAAEPDAPVAMESVLDVVQRVETRIRMRLRPVLERAPAPVEPEPEAEPAPEPVAEAAIDEAVVAAEPDEPVAPAIDAAPPEAEPVLAAQVPADTSPFVTVGAAALGIPLVVQALQQAQGGAGDEAAPSDADADAVALAPDAEAAHLPEMSESALQSPHDALASPGPDAPDAEAGPFEIAEVVARIDAFYTRQQERAATLPVPQRADGFRFETDELGTIRWVEGVSRAPLIGLSLELSSMPGESRADGVAAGALRSRAPFSDARLMIVGESDAAGEWRISATPAFDRATGRFTGYRGTARRPRREESAAPVAAPRANPAADSLRQLMHELRTPTNAIAGFAEMIEREMLGDAPPLYRERAGTIRTHARALLAAIDDLDIAARIDADAFHPGETDVALRPLLARIADELAPMAELRGAWISLPIADRTVRGDARAIERMLSRLLATLLSAAEEGERVGVAVSADAGRVAIRFDQPRALASVGGDALFAMDDEQQDGALLGTGFALRLVRNIARQLGGTLAIGPDAMTVELPALVTKSLEQAR
ncbi:signal transduction histidine kinase [Sphingomonas sp. BE123]|uniref:sensor histidine kinase n=1 Tax=Sphingomonas sp. BE123 TaxID=2817842 RepID=UPI002863A224|nr:HAMP domain-containing sensor histidine kinase [Sphingomonas sp. BE123]MDR6850858.1 signal transduction histidine kinase [Sphingomonas sp. BE123]